MRSELQKVKERKVQTLQAQLGTQEDTIKQIVEQVEQDENRTKKFKKDIDEIGNRKLELSSNYLNIEEEIGLIIKQIEYWDK